MPNTESIEAGLRNFQPRRGKERAASGIAACAFTIVVTNFVNLSRAAAQKRCAQALAFVTLAARRRRFQLISRQQQR